jgi:hypothetical protein
MRSINLALHHLLRTASARCALTLLAAVPLVGLPHPAHAREASGTASADAAALQPAQADSLWPAARRHVKVIDGRAYRLTSRLDRIVELNFTFGNAHPMGKAIIAAALDRIADTYGGITVRHIKQGTDGATGQQPDFTVDDLLSGQVIVANNVSMFGSRSMGIAKQQAIQKAIETDGRGYLGFHGSGENYMTNWPWFANTLHPLNFMGHSARSNGPVYKHLAEAKHVILEGILETRTTPATVPNEVDAGGDEVLAPNVPTRMMRSEWYKFGRQIADDPAYKDRVTILLKFDPRNLGATLEPKYRRKGGNMFTYLYKVGAGMTSYISPGHENDELLDPNTGFDGGAGDFDRYVAQTLFFLAGYDTVACDAACEGLPLVDERNHVVQAPLRNSYPDAGSENAGAFLDAHQPAFAWPFPGRYEARLLDTRGRLVKRMAGEGAARHVFDTRGLPPGIYLLTFKAGSRPVRVRRYVL